VWSLGRCRRIWRRSEEDGISHPRSSFHEAKQKESISRFEHNTGKMSSAISRRRGREGERWPAVLWPFGRRLAFVLVVFFHQRIVRGKRGGARRRTRRKSLVSRACSIETPVDDFCIFSSRLYRFSKCSWWVKQEIIKVYTQIQSFYCAGLTWRARSPAEAETLTVCKKWPNSTTSVISNCLSCWGIVASRR